MRTAHLGHRARRRDRGFGLLEMIIGFVLVIAASALVFVLWQIAHARAVAAREADYISAALGSVAATFPHGQYASAG